MADARCRPSDRRARTRTARRPSLPLGQLVRLSVYWLGLVAVFQGIGVILQERIKVLVPDPNIQYTTARASSQPPASSSPILVQPTVGSISDYTITRFGRRKPYILIGTMLDVVFLIGLATSNTILAVAAFVVLLQFSSNFAQGPFQGYVPDLVPAPQVGLASGMVGLFTVLGVVTGTRARVARARDWATSRWPTIALGVIELVDDAVAVLPARRGSHARRTARGRSWPTDRRRGVGHRHPRASGASCSSSRRASSSSAAARSSSSCRSRTSSGRSG